MDEKQVLSHVPIYPGIAAKNIAAILRCTKSDVNRILYGLQRRGVIQMISKRDCAPSFYVPIDIPKKKQDNASASYCMFIDAGNRANLLTHVDSHFSQLNVQPLFPVYVFADKHYNGIGVNPRSPFKCPQWFTLHQSESELRNAADIRLIRALFRHMDSHAQQSKRIAVVSADGQWAEIQNIAKEEGHHLEIISSLPSLTEWLRKACA